MKCRHCNTQLNQVFLDLGSMPPSNAYLDESDLSRQEATYPLKVLVCKNCWLVQTEDFTKPHELFSPDYAYFSSTSKSWLMHAKNYCEDIIKKFNFTSASLVVEIASNDGYLLKNFVEADIPCLGIEPTTCTADAAEKLNIPVLKKFFGEKLAQELASQNKKADLIIGNNVFAHVPDINDFTLGMSTLLKPEGIITLEFPHLMNLTGKRQFDTIYHEHYSYLSLYSVKKIFATAGLRIFDVKEIPTHGGSLRVYGCHEESNHKNMPTVEAVLNNEILNGVNSIETYTNFQMHVDDISDSLVKFLREEKNNNKLIAAYGAAAKGNTLLNYANVKNDMISFVSDAAPSKQCKFMPGSRIPILHPDEIKKRKPDYVLVLPWNLIEEVEANLNYIRDWGGKFVTAIPNLKIL